jgi:hypothetical protein
MRPKGGRKRQTKSAWTLTLSMAELVCQKSLKKRSLVKL